MFDAFWNLALFPNFTKYKDLTVGQSSVIRMDEFNKDIHLQETVKINMLLPLTTHKMLVPLWQLTDCVSGSSVSDKK